MVSNMALCESGSFRHRSPRYSTPAAKETGPAGIELESIKKVIKNIGHVQHVHHVHVWAISTTENALTAHVVIDEKLSFDEKLKVIDAIKHELEHHNIQHSTLEMAKSAL